MRRFLLDSAPLAAYLHGRKAAVDLIAPWLTRHEAATSILVYGELTEYLKGLPDFPLRHRQLKTLLREVNPYFLTYPILERYADLRRQLRPPHGPGLIGDIDTLIAATALERHLTLVTTDRDFERVPKVKLRLLSLRAAEETGRK
jgi:predicted nucleic acid-binding protein